jgi:nodulation protein E
VVPNRARPADVEYALSNSFAFGGLNAVLAFRKI